MKKKRIYFAETKAEKVYSILNGHEHGEFFAPKVFARKPVFLSWRWRSERAFKKIMKMAGCRPIITAEMRLARHKSHMDNFMLLDAGGTIVQSYIDFFKCHPDYEPFEKKDPS